MLSQALGIWSKFQSTLKDEPQLIIDFVKRLGIDDSNIVNFMTKANSLSIVKMLSIKDMVLSTSIGDSTKIGKILAEIGISQYLDADLVSQFLQASTDDQNQTLESLFNSGVLNSVVAKVVPTLMPQPVVEVDIDNVRCDKCDTVNIVVVSNDPMDLNQCSKCHSLL
jgi:phage FluMu protein Com